MLNYYNVLEVGDFAGEGEIKKAYRQKSRQYHPDLVGNLGPKLQRVAKREMALINRAYEILGNPARRSQYDIWLKTAKTKHGLRQCAVCGLYFAVDENTQDETMCSECLAAENGSAAGQQADEPAEDFSLKMIKACFVALQHFSRMQTEEPVTPVVKLVAGGERLHVSGPPGQLEITVFNKEIYDLVEEGKYVSKSPWSYVGKTGKISINKTHPAAAAKSLRAFCMKTTGEFDISYCRIEIPGGNYRSYAHILNQSVIMLLKKPAPWMASKLFVSYDKNLAAALAAPETADESPFFNLLANDAHGGAAQHGGSGGSGLELENQALRAEVRRLQNQLSNIIEITNDEMSFLEQYRQTRNKDRRKAM